MKGCDLSCVWCHSPESQGFGPDLAFVQSRCIGMESCGECQRRCEYGAITKCEAPEGPGKEPVTYPSVDRDKCTLCLKCTSVCPSKALYNTQRLVSVEECMEVIRHDKKYYENSGGGVTISGGEPMSQFDFCMALAKTCKEEGYHVALDTSGYAPTKQFLDILPYIDLFLYDLKHMDSERCHSLVGAFNEVILDNAVMLSKVGARFQIRIPIIPHLNDSEQNIRAAAAFCLDIRDSIDLVQLLPFHTMGENKYIQIGKKYHAHVNPPDNVFMQKQLKLFKRLGLPVRIG
ncbi:glycyl-radical enzyme activating protein [Desulfitobacterium hafniense]|uniref:Putative pyruvate-formate lyase-activating enzyme n=1 Tax=Desulfitobacterium hafniense (strain Y51) TaxID=138119 RepID=Q24T44_DESHY|nr:glycyl-radical enzyme activating protein [Desulfitobacterium hafniense]BAE84798.1 putative pyruvate-formate lyase-activating enzyme [Desulfitobacterium hafniense Y51]